MFWNLADPGSDKDRWLIIRLRKASDDPINMPAAGPCMTGACGKPGLRPLAVLPDDAPYGGRWGGPRDKCSPALRWRCFRLLPVLNTFAKASVSS